MTAADAAGQSNVAAADVPSESNVTAADASSGSTVTIALMSGEQEQMSLLEAETAESLAQRLQGKRPLAEGVCYKLLVGDRALEPAEVVPPPTLMAVVVKVPLVKRIAGDWRRDSGDHYFIGLRIAEDGKYECDSGSVRDGLVRVISEEERTINLRRTVNRANDHLFTVAADCETMEGRCPQSGVRWKLSKKP